MTSMLEATDIRLILRGHTILNGVTLRVGSGETVGLVGPNGCGKTSFFNVLSGFYESAGGRMTFAGRDITNLPAHQRAQLGLGRVFQSFGVFREMTVGENMVMALEGRYRSWQSLVPWGPFHRKLAEEARALLAQVALSDRYDELAGALSGGQQRLLEIVRARAFGSTCLLLDEPTAGVSPRMKEDVARLIQSLQSEGRTILVIEHDLAFIQSFCRRVVVMNEGQIVLDGAPEVVREDPALRDIYFGSGAGA